MNELMNDAPKKNMIKRRFFIFLCSASISISFSQTPKMIYLDKTQPIDKRVEDLLSRMTVEEKVAQMRVFQARLGVEMNENNQLSLNDDVKKRVANGIGGIKNPAELYSPERAAILNNQLQEYIIKASRFGIPGLFITETYNGIEADGCTVFGRPINFASTWNKELVKRVYSAMGREARLRGLNMTHSPEADLVRDPRFGRMSEAFGEDTHLVTEMTVSAVKGLQGDDIGLSSTHIGAVTKHFAAYAQIAGGKNFASIEISQRTLNDEVFPSFKAAVQRANTLGIMASHGDINGIACHSNPELFENILRKQWNYKGYVVSDSQDIGRLFFFMKVAESPEEAVRLALTAGVDVDLFSDVSYSLLPEMAKKNPDLLKYIDQSTGRVLRTKFVLGLFENPYSNAKKAREQTRNEDNKATALEADLESIILLKNEKGILPLSKTDKKTIALVGPVLGKNSKDYFVEIAGSTTNFSSQKGYNLTNGEKDIPKLTSKKETKTGIENILKTVQSADVIVLFVGDDKFTAKEATFNSSLGDRDNIDLVGEQDSLFTELKKTGKPVVVVLKHRRTLSINTIAKNADAILDCWELSEFGDKSIAKIIFGESCPSGKLTVTVPRSIGQLPFHYSQKEINYFKSYLFSESSALFPFGFGLSYTKFDYSNLKISSPELDLKSTITVSVDVKNSGTMTAKEVVQLYIKDMIGQVLRPMKELKGFEKIELKAGETKTVSFTITPEMLEFTGLNLERINEAGDYVAIVGTSSAENQKIKFRLTENSSNNFRK